MAVTENTRRGLFTLSGITGMLIATVLLLAILVGLTMWDIQVQQQQATNYYDPAPIVGSTTNVKAISTDNAKFAFQPAK
jgi:uncharacterized membrane protein SpoIIM required for sporulation